MESKADIANQNCEVPNCCRQIHDSKEQQFLTQLGNIVELTMLSFADRGEVRGDKSQRVYNRRPKKRVRTFDLNLTSSVHDGGSAWETEFPISTALLEILEPENLSQFTPDSQRIVNATVNNAHRLQTIRTTKIVGCPFR